MTNPPPAYVSRAGTKLAHALEEFGLDVAGLDCADFGCNVGGFTDCLLQRGASHVYAIDTGYGTLAYTLRRDERVTVMERTNALHVAPAGRVDLVVIDMAWTPQRLAIPASLRWLADGGRIITLVKPHYELDAEEKRAELVQGRLDPQKAEHVLERVLAAMPSLGGCVRQWAKSPLTGGKSKRSGTGNVEFLALVEPM